MAETAKIVAIKIKAGGTTLVNEAVLGLSVTYLVNTLAYAEIRLLDGDISKKEFKLSSNGDLAPGQPLEIEIGHDTTTKPLFKGIIVRHQLKVDASVGSYISLEVKHKAVKMSHVRHTKHFLDKKDGEIIEQLIKDHGLTADVASDPKTKHERMIQYQISDWDFMVLRAEACGLVVHTFDDKVIVQKPKIASGGPKATLGDNVYEFEAELDARDQFAKGSGISWDHSTLELVEGKSADPSDAEAGGNPKGKEMGESLGAAEFKLRHPGELPDTELEDWASGALLRSRLSKLRGRVQLMGSVDLQAGGSLDLDGFGDTFNGSAYISGVCHHVAHGVWLTDVQLGLDEAMYMSKSPHIVDPPVSGLLAPMRGLHIGTIKEVKDDPAGFFRAQVKLSVIDDPEDGIWCRVAHADAGAGHSVFFMPQVGDEVVVGFLHEDPRHAIIIGRLHNNDANKPAIEDNDEYKKSGIFTTEKLSFIFNDEDKSVILETPAGKKIIVDEKEDTIRLEDDHNNKIEMNKDGITIESGKDVIIKATANVTIEGVNIEQSASAQFKAEGSAGIEVSSSAMAVLKGSLVQIN